MNTGQAARHQARRAWWLVRSGSVRLDRARTAATARAALEARRVRIARDRMTLADLRVLVSVLALAAGPRPGRPGGEPVRFAGWGLTTVNAAAMAVVVAHLLVADLTHPVRLAGAIVLGAGYATAQAVLARDVGRWLRPFAATPRPLESPSSGVVGAALLAVTAGLAGVAVYEWVQTVEQGALAGLTLLSSAVAAPFLLVAREVHGPGPDARLLGRAERVLEHWDRRCRRLDRRVVREFGAAWRRLWRAERRLAVLTALLAPHHPQDLADAIDRLRTGLAAHPGGHAPVEPPPIDPDDLDLAG